MAQAAHPRNPFFSLAPRATTHRDGAPAVGGLAAGTLRQASCPQLNRPTARWLRATTIKVYPADSFALSFAVNSLILEQTHGKYG